MCRLTVEELRSGNDPVLFAFAGAGGVAGELSPLAAELPGDPRVVALACAADPATDTVASLAREAVALVRATQPHGPYRLLGYSFGGLLALESAQLLRAEGETVAFVGVVDSFFDQQHWPTSLFVRATGRRAAVHLRALRHQPPGRAARELSGRAARLARRLGGRYAGRSTAPAPTGVQAGNIAVMAGWRPRVLEGPVTLFAATAADFGCDLAELWRPWLPQLDVRRVWGSHLDLTQTPRGTVRLARAVGEAMEASPPRLKVLVATTFRWPGAARLAADLNEVGCSVDAVAPRRNAVHSLAAVQRSHHLRLADPLHSLRHAIEASEPDLVVPFDDRTRHALGLLHQHTDPRTESGARLRACLERSLGRPEKYAGVYSRAHLMEIADAAGVLCPPTAVMRSAEDVSQWLAENPGAAVLKTDGSWGGRGVVVVRTEAEGRSAWRDLSRRPPFLRALKRLVVEGDPWALRARLCEKPPVVSIQTYVPGRPANVAIAAFGGTTLGTVQAEVVESDGPTGPSTVVRIIDNPDIAYAAKSIVNSLELSGLCGLDFILDEDGRAHLLELNPRATPTSHLVAGGTTDLLTALRMALGHERPAPRVAAHANGTIALFPQELRRDPHSANLGIAHHDVPSYAPDLVAQVLEGPLLRRRRRRPARSSSLGIGGP